MKLPPVLGALGAALRLWHFVTATLAAPQYDWQAHCQALGLTAKELLDVAAQEGLPKMQLSSRQSEQLLKALKKYAAQKNAEAIAQQSLF